RYFARRDFPELLKVDEIIRKYLKTGLPHAAIADVYMERTPAKVTVTVHTGRPGVVIGKRGAAVDKLRDELAQLTGKEVGINVEEIKRPELDAQLVADSVAHQLTQRISFRRAMKRAVQSAMRMGAQGIKIKTAGRLGGAEVARTAGQHARVRPLRADGARAGVDHESPDRGGAGGADARDEARRQDVAAALSRQAGHQEASRDAHGQREGEPRRLGGGGEAGPDHLRGRRGVGGGRADGPGAGGGQAADQVQVREAGGALGWRSRRSPSSCGSSRPRSSSRSSRCWPRSASGWRYAGAR